MHQPRFPLWARRIGTIFLVISFFLPFARCEKGGSSYSNDTEMASSEQGPRVDYYYPVEVFYEEDVSDLAGGGFLVLFALAFFWPLAFLIVEYKVGRENLGPGPFFLGGVLIGINQFLILIPFLFYEIFIGFFVFFGGSLLLFAGFLFEGFSKLKGKPKTKKK